MGIKSRMYLDEEVENTERIFGSTDRYLPVYFVDGDGNEVPGMFTEHAIRVAVETAAKNPEDMPGERGFFEKLFLG